jgi:cytoskeletal protein CcmA (bactofilin family)
MALAVCGDLAAENTLTLDPRTAAGADGAALVVSGRTRVGSPLRVGGAFTSVTGIEGDNTEDIAGALRTNGDWRVGSPAKVGGDATVGGLLTANNTVEVTGTLRVASSTGSAKVTSGQRIDGPVSVASPIDCAGAPDIAALVRAGGDPNVGHVHPTPIDALADVREKTTASIGCDRYRFSQIVAQGELVLRVEGNAVIVVDGDVRIKAPTRIELAPNATLDLAIGGALEIENTFSISGGPAWVGVKQRVRVGSPTEISGWLIAPTAAIAVENTLTLTGGAFLGPVRVGSPVVVKQGGSVAADGCVSL